MNIIAGINTRLTKIIHITNATMATGIKAIPSIRAINKMKTLLQNDLF
jgi:hypothetical protein